MHLTPQRIFTFIIAPEFLKDSGKRGVTIGKRGVTIALSQQMRTRMLRVDM